MAKRRILICGATGFIGRNIAETFAGNPDYDVVGVYNKRPPFVCTGLDWIKADLTNPADVERAIRGVDTIVQAAATTSGSKDIVTRPYIHVTDNAVMNSLLFRAAHDHGVKHVVFFSCTVMYPSSEKALSEDDFDAHRGIHPRYFGVGWTKVYVEKLCEFYAGLGRTRYTAIRHSNIYGPHDKFDLERSHVFGATVTKVLSATDGKITVWGAGEEARDLLYVGDLVDFVDRAIRKQETPYELFCCGLGSATKVKDLVAKINRISGRNLRIEHDLSQPSIPTSLHLDCSKAERVLGWKPATSLEDGIRRTIDWWLANIAPARAVASGSR
ncbi:MAG TPA: NAD(P)-dependent oxidoreductase [Alphaproteobacteria bacterium]|nr:NAD(P)-dependent oxidoreductase [Alphaproteobacteria bacterium]